MVLMKNNIVIIIIVLVLKTVNPLLPHAASFDPLYSLLEIQPKKIIGQHAQAHIKMSTQHCLEWWKVRGSMNVHQKPQVNCVGTVL